MSLLDRAILVTGSTSGIGLSTVKKILEEKANVYAVGRNFSSLNDFEEKSAFPNSIHISYDLMNLDGYRELVDKLPSFDGIVLSSGIVDSNPIKFFSMEKYNKVITLNQTSPLLMVAELCRANKINKGASIVFVSSISGAVMGMKGLAAYAASKAALVGMTKVLALELGRRDVRVNCVSPGMVNTPLVDNSSQLSRVNIEEDKKRYPLGQRYAEPGEIANTISFLLSDYSGFITGQNIVVDGGRSVC